MFKIYISDIHMFLLGATHLNIQYRINKDYSYQNFKNYLYFKPTKVIIRFLFDVNVPLIFMPESSDFLYVSMLLHKTLHRTLDTYKCLPSLDGCVFYLSIFIFFCKIYLDIFKQKNRYTLSYARYR